MHSFRSAAFGLALLVTAGPVFAMEGNSEQPHNVPFAVTFAGGYAGPDVGSEQDPGFDIRLALPLRAERGAIVGRTPDGTVRLADAGNDLNG